MKWLDKIRQKDDFEKNRFAILSAGFITLIIVFVWFVAKYQDFNTVAKNVASPAESFKSMFQVLK